MSYKINKKLIIKRAVTYWVAAEVILLLLIVGSSYFKKEDNRYTGEGVEQVRVYTQFRALPEKSESLDKRKEIPK